MITPRFSCSQTPETVIISIYCPSVRAADVEMHIDETLFSVHINPYFLRLNFSHPVLEDDASSAHYDPSSGYLKVTLTKETKGQEFHDLDLLAKLLNPRPSKKAPIIEVVSSESSSSDRAIDINIVTATERLTLDRERQEILQAAENDWQLPQATPDSIAPELSLQKYYGFLGMHSGYFRHVTHTENEVNELGADAETCSAQERRRRRIKHENNKWDPDYYMADYADDEHIQELLRWEHPHVVDAAPFQYSEVENMTVLSLPRKEYLSTSTQTRGLYLTLLTILFSYAYESRTTQCEPTTESAWTLCNLIPAFSALDPPDVSIHPIDEISPDIITFTEGDILACLQTSYRRSLAFPLYRSFALAEACRMDVAHLFSKGKRTVVRCLLEMKNILDHHDIYYVYSKIWVDDFCTWTQTHASDEAFAALGKLLLNLKIKKQSIGWDLEELEAATQIAERESDSDDESSDGSDSLALNES